MESENIRVYLRIRPFVEREDNAANDGRPKSIVEVIDEDRTAVRVLENRAGVTLASDAEVFAFDGVGDMDAEQESVFEMVAKPIAENCLLGYNGTIFA